MLATILRYVTVLLPHEQSGMVPGGGLEPSIHGFTVHLGYARGCPRTDI